MGDGVGAVTPHPGTLEPPQSPVLSWELCSPLTWAHPPRRAATPSIALAEEPGLPPGHAGPPGTDGEWPWAPRGAGGCPHPTTALTHSLLLPGHLGAHCLLPRPGAAAGRCRNATGHPGTRVGGRDSSGLCPSQVWGPILPNLCLLFLQDASLGQVSFSIFGSFGAALQVVLILYPSDGHLCPQQCPLCPQHCSQRHPILFSSLTLLAAI